MPLDEQDITKINELISAAWSSEAFTKAVGTAAGKAVEGLKLEELIAAKVTEGTKDLVDKIKALDEAGGEGGGKGGSDAEAESEAIRKLKQRLDEQEQRARAAEQARAEAERKARTDRLYGAARDALTAAGVSRPDHALAVLKDRGLLTYTSEEADGTPGFKGENEYGQEAVLPMDKGLAAWLKTDDGKAFMPASDRRGNGDRGGRRPETGTGTPQSAEAIVNNALGGLLRF